MDGKETRLSSTQPTTFHRRRISIDGLGFNVIVEGEGNTRGDVLLVHGFPDTHQVWRHQIPALVAAGYRVIAPDNRGFGDTDIPTGKGAFKVARFVRDLVGILDALAIDKVTVVGHDWGAVCGWALAINHPERVERYVAMSVGHPEAYPRGGLAQKLKGYYVLIFASPLGQHFARLFNWRVFDLVLAYRPELPHWHAMLRRPGRLHAAIGIYRDNLALIFPQRFPRVQVPVLGIWSSGDHALARKQMVISGEYVDAGWRYVEIDGASHWLQLDQPRAINALLLDYLRDGASGPQLAKQIRKGA